MKPDGAATAPVSPGQRRDDRRPNVAAWMGAAFGAAVLLAVGALAWFGVGASATETALRLTARLGFLFFWLSYAAGALTTLFGAAFLPLKRRAPALGLAFGAVLTVHLGLVAWLCWIGHAPPAETFAIFGVGAVWAYLLVFCSIDRLGRAIGAKGWWILRNVGMNYIAFVFALDFLGLGHKTTLLAMAEYLPFEAFAILGPLLKLAAWLKREPSAASPSPGRT